LPPCIWKRGETGGFEPRSPVDHLHQFGYQKALLRHLGNDRRGMGIDDDLAERIVRADRPFHINGDIP